MPCFLAATGERNQTCLFLHSPANQLQDHLFTENAIWVPVEERRVVGHADIINEFEQIPGKAIAARPEQNRNAA